MYSVFELSRTCACRTPKSFIRPELRINRGCGWECERKRTGSASR
jgi:hypothetical protein